jgi:large conductance mechanosensitive channel
MLKDFKDFIMRGNVVDLAVAVVIGAEFGAVVNSMVKDIITPLIGAIFGQPDFSSLSITINGSQLMYGNLLNSIITFLSVAIAVFFLVVQPINKLSEIAKKGKNKETLTRECPECLGEIPAKAKRCMHCGVKLTPNKL